MDRRVEEQPELLRRPDDAVREVGPNLDEGAGKDEHAPLPVGHSQRSGGGRNRRSGVSVDTALWDGPRDAAQSWVTASSASGRGARCTTAGASAVPDEIDCASSACSSVRRVRKNTQFHPTATRKG